MEHYKLTTSNHQTKNKTQWGAGVTHKALSATGLCEGRALHGYLTPGLAAFLNPIHREFDTPICWRAVGHGQQWHDGLKMGFTEQTTVKVVPLPDLTLEQRVEIAIRIALITSDCLPPNWIMWAESWLTGSDRSAAAARAAAAAAEAAAEEAEAEAEAEAAWAGDSRAARAARAAARAARAAARAASAAAWAAAAWAASARAAEAAEAAARAAEAAARAWAAAAAAAAAFMVGLALLVDEVIDDNI